jgi:hypothetical protein
VTIDTPAPPAGDLPTGELPHIASHRHLVELPAVLSGTLAPIDAVVVPATRPDASLHHAAGVARRAGCPLLVLCSRGMDAETAVATVSRRRRPPRMVAVDVHGDYGTLDVKLRTDDFPMATHGRGDASHKRNLGVLLARMLGWRSVLFLDDDVVGMDVDRLARTQTLLAAETPGGDVEAVGWSFEAFADNSVVCHANRSTGGVQDTFVGAGGLAVRVHPGTPFFPNVYNEDWLFLYDSVARGRVLLAGGMIQLSYDPFDHAARAEHQEFGDLFAESLFALLHERATPSVSAVDLDLLLAPARSGDWWRDRIRRRREFLSGVAGRVPAGNLAMARSLARARDTLLGIAPVDLADYTAAWREDLATWADLLAALPRTDLARALEVLRLEGVGDVGRLRPGPGQALRARVSARVSAGSRAPSRR